MEVDYAAWAGSSRPEFSPMNGPETHFKGWAKPGPVPPGAIGEGPAVEPGETLDAISGHFRLFQLVQGHRFSTDDVLVAWYGSSWCPCGRSILDLGSGVGTIGIMVAWRLAGARVVMVEAQEESARLARKTVEWNGLQGRAEVRIGDFRQAGVIGAAEQFDLICGSPPYFPIGSGVVGDHPQKVACRFELRGDVADYCAAAARHLAPGGFFACVFPVAPPEQAERVEAAARAAGMSIVRTRPIVLREGERPLLGLFGMMRSADLPEKFRGPTWEEPALIIRRVDGRVHPEYSAVKMSFGFPP